MGIAILELTHVMGHKIPVNINGIMRVDESTHPDAKAEIIYLDGYKVLVKEKWHEINDSILKLSKEK